MRVTGGLSVNRKPTLAISYAGWSRPGLESSGCPHPSTPMPPAQAQCGLMALGGEKLRLQGSQAGHSPCTKGLSDLWLLPGTQATRSAFLHSCIPESIPTSTPSFQEGGGLCWQWRGSSVVSPRNIRKY